MHIDGSSSEPPLFLTKPVVVQLPVYTHDESFHIVETTIHLPQFYAPEKGSFFAHPVLPGIGRLNIAWWGYDGRDNKTYIALSVGYHDPTRNIHDFLAEYPVWQLCDDPMLTVSEKEDDSGNDRDDANADPDW